MSAKILSVFCLLFLLQIGNAQILRFYDDEFDANYKSKPIDFIVQSNNNIVESCEANRKNSKLIVAVDSIVLPKPKLNFKNFIAPAILVGGGYLLMQTEFNTTLQNKIQNGLGNNFQTQIDDYTQFVPIIQIYTGHLLGLKSKNSIKQQTINLVVANLITGGVVFGLKKTFKETRPDFSGDNSFPSGHTATAFTNASMLFHEYKDSNIWYAGSGYLFATATGILRVANNRHFMSDVLTGAGIGIGVGFLVSYWSPLQSFSIGKNKKTQAVLYPNIGESCGLGILIKN